MKTEKALLSKKELLDIFVNHRVDSPFPGDWESIFKGAGFEFWAIRELTPTDSYKHIDWKATAKTGKFYVREFLAESYYNLMLIYDISNSISFGRKECLQANIAVSLAYTAISNNNGCGLILFADDVISYLPARMGWPHFMQIVTTIATAAPVPCRETRLNNALGKLLSELPESLTFILSDFLFPFESAYSFQHSLQGTRTHEVKAIQVLETCEIRLPEGSAGVITFFDYESGQERQVDLKKRRRFNTAMAHKMEEIRRELNRTGIDLLTIFPEDHYPGKINAFMRNSH